MNNIMTELQEALRAAGHGADEVQNAPVDMLNVWLDDKGQMPAATVCYESMDDGGKFVWGSHWEHSIATSVSMDDAVSRIVETSTTGGD
jgi:hypothetical protein